ncbi:transporter substrate-binding domain-containing protein [Devosia sp. I507]|uniref:transporter substrate-binding domain-containing protein n=1 Tax=Devosia sp. I507 TaxID=2083786 RepID=UPI000CE97C7E|nr:transporter substrate-binding domain-containing protein [Devosia sp. I507]AVF04333.1 ABC transporter substrate-binding protein [Devosia sp. I507]
MPSFIQITRRTMLMLGAATSLAFALTGGVAAQTLDEIRTKGTLTVGTLVDFPPFGLLDLNGQPDGYDPELARMLADRLGVELEIVPVSGPNRVPYLLSNRVDLLIAALGITAERAEQVDFSDPSATVNQVVYAPKDMGLATLEDLSGRSIGVARGSAQDITLTASVPADATIQRFDDDPTTLQALLSGQVDTIAMSTLLIADIGKVANVEAFEIKFPIQTLVHGIAMRKDNPELLDFVNTFLAEAKADGTLNEAHRKWVGVDFTDVEKPVFE